MERRKNGTFKKGIVPWNKGSNKFIDHPLYLKWRSIKNRCYNKNQKSYKNYGGRGIKLSKRYPEFTERLKEKFLFRFFYIIFTYKGLKKRLGDNYYNYFKIDKSYKERRFKYLFLSFRFLTLTNFFHIIKAILNRIIRKMIKSMFKRKNLEG